MTTDSTLPVQRTTPVTNLTRDSSVATLESQRSLPPPLWVSTKESTSSSAGVWIPGAADTPDLFENEFLAPYNSLEPEERTLWHGPTKGVREGSEMLLARLAESFASREATITRYSGNRIVYFSENSSWSFTIQDQRSPAPTSSPGTSEDSNPGTPADGAVNQWDTRATPVHSTHYSIPETMDDRAHNLPDSGLDLSNDEAALLCKKGAFTLPPRPLQDALLTAYFRWMQPAHFVLDRHEFMQRYQEGRTSLLLLQAIFFVGAIYAPDEVICEHFPSRQAAELMFFKRAKALYEAEHEADPITIIQALYLMSFWWASPTERKDIGHWLGAAISLAQARGMHRS